MHKLIYLSLVFFITACASGKLKEHSYPVPEDTSTKPINDQVKTSYRFDGVYVDNEFDGARMNGFRQINDTTFRVIVSPENTPINASSYFAFRIRSERDRRIDLEIEYTEHEHRYVPKLSKDRLHWTAMDTTEFDTIKAGNLATLRLEVDAGWLYVAGQELMTSSDCKAWADSLDHSSENIRKLTIGKSIRGRDIYCLNMDWQSVKKKPAIVIFGRLHPPEVSGYMAMLSFVDELLKDNQIATDFRNNYRILVYPMINPDGVDLGHWRHNTGGIDLNRDWSSYKQQEVRLVAEHLTSATRKMKNSVVLALDFHSTQEDLYYTLTDNRISVIDGFKDYWFEAIDSSFQEYTPQEEAYDFNQAITKSWFFKQFGAESITYEVGDETPRSFVDEKARVAAREMMKLLVLKKND